MPDHRTRRFLARALAAAFLAGEWDRAGLTERARATVIPPPRRLRHVVDRVLAAYPRPPRDAPRELAAFVEVVLDAVRGRAGPPPPPAHVRRWLLDTGAMGPRRWPAVPDLATVADLGAFLDLDAGRLAWLADVRSWERAAPDRRLRHYTYAWIARPDAPVRLLEQPKPRLKAIQRRLLHEVLAWIPAHPAAHGFVAGRSVAGHAAAHCGAPAVLRFDVEDFFVSLAAGRVWGVLRTAGYPEAVAHALTGLMTNSVAAGAWAEIPAPSAPHLRRAHALLGRRLAAPHLPQGAPTSPMLANLCAFSLDRRLAGLAARLGATYTRYADDLVLSGGPGLARRAEKVTATVRAIVADEGLRLNERKTRVMTAGGRQVVGGIVVNQRTNVPREEFDRLKAILHNAARHGPASQNRAGVADFRAHLLGRIAWVAALNPARGARLLRVFDAIDWDAAAAR
ncbi:reverse transcriptase family protein [Baekduia sp.]|uniref:reverse transcriptase family protein n=1 Tax=Baekduia sp. TaxID=2600305 RepID=UPI002D1FB1E8|nr:reverse transcriptase family protein [Baekduia sp.]